MSPLTSEAFSKVEIASPTKGIRSDKTKVTKMALRFLLKLKLTLALELKLSLL